MVMTSVYRRAAAAVICCVMLVAQGCTSVYSREPVGQEVKMEETDSKAVQTLDKLYSHVWLNDDKEDFFGVMQFQPGERGEFVLKMTGFGYFPLAEESGSGGQSAGPQTMEYMGLARVWGDHLILHLVTTNSANKGSMLQFALVSAEEDPVKGLMLRIHYLKLEGLQKARKDKDGKEVKLEIEEIVKKEGNNGGSYLVKSDAKTIMAYLDACKPEDLFDMEKKDSETGLKASKASFNYQGRPKAFWKVKNSEQNNACELKDTKVQGGSGEAKQ